MQNLQTRAMKIIVGDMLIPSNVVDHAAVHIEDTRETCMFIRNMLYQCALLLEFSSAAWYCAFILRRAGWLGGWL